LNCAVLAVIVHHRIACAVRHKARDNNVADITEHGLIDEFRHL
jgi:hypothetical protein